MYNYINEKGGVTTMITKEEYLLNPCGTLSIPYWKNKTIIIPSNIAIIHKKTNGH